MLVGTQRAERSSVNCAPLIRLKQLLIISIRSGAVLTRTSECLISRLSNNYILHHRSTIYIQESLLVHLVACSSTSRALRSCVDVDGDVLFKEGMEWTAVQSAECMQRLMSILLFFCFLQFHCCRHTACRCFNGNLAKFSV